MSLDVQHAFGTAMRGRRSELGITLDQLAQSCGISSGALSRIERGAMSTSLPNAVAIAAALGCELTDLLSTDAPVSIVRRGEAAEFIDPDTGISRALLARPVPGAELVRYVLPGHSRTAEFAAHRPRTVEVFHVIAGAVSISGDGSLTADLAAGDTARIPGDRPHRIINASADEARLLLLVAQPR